MNENEELQKIDLLRERMRCGYEEAKCALDRSEGSVTAALALIERERRSANQDLLTLAGELLGELDEIAREGAIRKLRVRFADRVVKEIPLFATAGAALLITLCAIVLSQTSIELEREPASAPEAPTEDGA